jgi:hypothetical protein
VEEAFLAPDIANRGVGDGDAVQALGNVNKSGHIDAVWIASAFSSTLIESMLTNQCGACGLLS